MDIRRPQPIDWGQRIMGYNKKEQVEMLRTYPPRISRKRVRQSMNDEEDGSWNENSPAKRKHRSVPTLCNAFIRMHLLGLECIL